jgi:hypothetical protein
VKLKRIMLPSLLAVAWTGLNAFKPPVIDDPAYLALARQISRAPLDPYGFEQFWYQEPEPANHILAPPVLPYWLGLGIRFFGENVVLLKLWLFPVAALFLFAADALLRRFAPRVAAPFLIATVVTPSVLPAFNFMLDVPALAFALAAAALFLHSLDKRSLGLALAAGLVAGLATQTKYTGLLALPLLTGISLLYRRLLAGLLASGMAALLFAGWELFIWSHYRESHFLYSVENSQTTFGERLNLAGTGVTLLGGVAPGLAMLGLASLGVKRLWVLVAAALLATGYAVLAIIPDSGASDWLPWEERDGIGALAHFLTGCGWCVLGVLAVIGFCLAFRFRPDAYLPILRRRLPRSLLVLLLWFGIEIGGFFVLTPFPATRRVMGMTVIGTLLIGWLASRTCRSVPRRRTLWLAVCATGTLGLFYAGIDLADARTEPRAVCEATKFIRDHDAEPTIWFTGHWGLHYEAEREGGRPLIPGYSLLQTGDWLIVAPDWMPRQKFVPDERQGRPLYTVRIDRCLRLRTLPAYYGGRNSIEWWPSPMLELKIYRIESAWIPESPNP